MIIRPLFPSLRISSLRQLQQYVVPFAVSSLLWTLGLWWSQSSNAAVLDDHPLLPASNTTIPWVEPLAVRTVPPASTRWVDLGYMLLEAESCTSLGPAADRINALLFSNVPALATREAATLSHHWRQVQHHKAGRLESGHTQQCYYIAQ